MWHGPGDYDYYNAAMLVDSTGVLNAQEPYRKSYLVPIVERVPSLAAPFDRREDSECRDHCC